MFPIKNETRDGDKTNCVGGEGITGGVVMLGFASIVQILGFIRRRFQ